MNNVLCCIAVLFGLWFAMPVKASKAVVRPFKVTLKDGRTVTASLRGDEYHNFYATNRGELIIRENDRWRVANVYEQEMETARAKAAALRRANEQIVATRPFPHTGTPKAVVILVNFADRKMTYSRDDFDRLLNSPEYNGTDNTSFETRCKSYGSALQYFSDCSNGQFRPRFDLYGPYDLNKKTSYYGANNDANVGALIHDACTAADKDVDFTGYDGNGDGYIDLVYVLYAGYGANMSDDPDDLWPKSGTTYDSSRFDGKALYRYGINNELLGWEGIDRDFGLSKVPMVGIGVFCHEMSHTMGLPDMYPTESWSDLSWYDNQSMEGWDLMDYGENMNNGYDPTPYTAWEREWMGWSEPLETIGQPGYYDLIPLRDGGKGMKIENINDPSRNEYYILESIPGGSKAGWYRSMPGRGMVVTHINYKESEFGNFAHPNNVHGKPRITIIPANGYMYSSYNFDNDGTVENNWKGNPFPGTTDVTELTEWREYNTGIRKMEALSNISRDTNGVVRFRYSTIRGDANDDGEVTVADIVATANTILGKRPEAFNEEQADSDHSGDITVSDIVLDASYILRGSWNNNDR